MNDFATLSPNRRWSDFHVGLRRARKAAGLTQRDVARMLDVDQATVSRWEAGTQIPEIPQRSRLRELLFRGRALDDARLRHLVRSSTGLVWLLSRDGDILVNSASCRAHSVRENIANIHDAASDSLDRAWELAHREGLFRGDVASIRFAASWPDGCGQVARSEVHWHPATLADGSILLLGEGRLIDIPTYEELNAAGPRIVPLEELLEG